MEPYQERVIEERKELEERLIKLVAFIESAMFYDLQSDEKLRLQRQRDAMRLYLYILNERVKAWEKEK